MDIPVVAIVGRPNVGKSSLLNSLAKKFVSIVDPVAGTTRDRVSAFLEFRGREFELVDTGGMGNIAPQLLAGEIEAQIGVALRKADLIVFVADAKDGLAPFDREIAARLRTLGKPLILVVNKVDSPRDEAVVGEFLELGLGEPSVMCALEGVGRTDLLERIVSLLPEASAAEAAHEAPPMKLAILGRQNAGKSTLVNTLAGEERVIVSELPGTTRDAIDVQFTLGEKRFVAIDTAGVRKKVRLKERVDFYSLARAEHSIRRADVVLLLVDAQAEITDVDKKIARHIEEQVKPCIMAINKWDLAKGIELDKYVEYIRDRLPGINFAPITFISGKTGHNVKETMGLAQALYEQANIRVNTSRINTVVEKAVSARSPAPMGRRLPKIYYGTQTGVAPPTIVLFVNDPALFPSVYARYLMNCFREELPFSEVPIRLYFRSHRARTDPRPGSKPREPRSTRRGPGKGR